MSRAAQTGLPPAVSQLEAMNRLISAEDRARGTDLAASMPTMAPPAQTTAAPSARVAQAQPTTPTQTMPVPTGPVRITQTQPQRPQPQTQRSATQPAPRPTPPTAAPAQGLASSGGRWRIQLGAFSSEAAARHAWSSVSGRLVGLQPNVVRAGAVFRLQAGPLASRAAADRACAAARQACFPVAP
jgi:cell division septation protein DedD